MDDIIVIILTLVLTIFAALSQAKKKKRQVPVPTETNEEHDIWEEIILGGKKEPKPVKAEIPYPQGPSSEAAAGVVSKKPKQGKLQNHYSNAGRNENIAALSNQLTDDEEGILEDFNLRKAIIYTEIIKPKYF